MNTRVTSLQPSLTETLPGAQFRESHHGIVDAPVEDVWRALHAVRWADLRVARPFLVARGMGLGGGLDRGALATFVPTGAVAQSPPVATMFVIVGKPWSPVPVSRPIADVAEASAFGEPGWLAYGMEWRLTPLPDGRTLVETTTLCRATDQRARRRFGLYWLIIRGPSGLIRRELIAAVRRIATRAA